MTSITQQQWQDTEALLTGLGLSAQDVQRLRAAGAVA